MVTATVTATPSRRSAPSSLPSRIPLSWLSQLPHCSDSNTRRTCQPSKSMSNEILLHMTHQVFSVQAPGPAFNVRLSRNFPNSGLERCTSKPCFDSPATDVRSPRARDPEKKSARRRQNSLRLAPRTFVLTRRARDPGKKIRVLPPSHDGLPFKHAHV